MSKIKVLIIGKNSNLSKHFQYFMKNKPEINLVSIGREEGFDHKNNKKFKNFILNFKPDFILNFYGLTNHNQCERLPDLANEINAIFPYKICQLCKKIETTFVHFSTEAIHDGRINKLHKVEDLPKPRTVLGKTKLNGEKLIFNFSNSIIFRLPMLYGEFFKSGFVFNSLVNIKKKKYFYLCDDIYCSPINAKKVVDYVYKKLILVRAKKSFLKRKIIQISNNKRFSRYSFIKMICNSIYLKKDKFKNLKLKSMPDQFMGLKKN
jgi:dTDP-4-dehydrorhamnose reductase